MNNLKEKIVGFLMKYDNVVGKDLSDLLNAQKEELLKKLPKEIEGESIEHLGSDFCTPRDYSRNGWNKALKEVKEIIENL